MDGCKQTGPCLAVGSALAPHLGGKRPLGRVDVVLLDSPSCTSNDPAASQVEVIMEISNPRVETRMKVRQRCKGVYGFADGTLRRYFCDNCPEQLIGRPRRLMLR